MFREALLYALASTKSGSEMPSLTEIVENIRDMYPRSRFDHEIKMALLRRLQPLTEGRIARVFDSHPKMSLKNLLEKQSVIFDLSPVRGLRTRVLLALLLLRALYSFEYGHGFSSELRRLTIIEEARHLVPARREYDKPSPIEFMIGELRKYGCGVLTISQSPNHIAQDVLRDSGFLFAHRLYALDDIRVIQRMMGGIEEDLLKQLPVGYALVRYPIGACVSMVEIMPVKEILPVDR